MGAMVIMIGWLAEYTAAAGGWAPGRSEAALAAMAGLVLCICVRGKNCREKAQPLWSHLTSMWVVTPARSRTGQEAQLASPPAQGVTPNLDSFGSKQPRKVSRFWTTRLEKRF